LDVIGPRQKGFSIDSFSRQKRLLWCTACALALILFGRPVSFAAAAQEVRAKRVLVISTGSRFSVGFPIVEQNAVEKLRQLYPAELEFYSEYLDIVRFPSASYHRVFRDYLRDKYADDVPDLIVLIYVGNLGVAEKLLEQIYPDTPVVAAGLTEEEYPAGPLSGRVTGIAQRSDPSGTIDLLRRLQPEIQRLVLIGGSAEVDRQVMNRAKQAASSFAGEIEVWDQRSIQEILKAVTSLPPKTAILFTRMFRDGAGRAVISAQAAQSIARVSNGSVYVMSDNMIGTGAVGGSVADIAALGRRAGELAHHVLNGSEPRSIPLEILTQGVPIFDWRALKRWGISESRLPPDSLVRFRPQSMWEQYRWYILSALIIIGVQAAMIAALLAQRRRRRRAESELSESRQLMEMAVSAGDIGLWSRDPKQGHFWANSNLRALFGIGENESLKLDDLLARIHPDDRTRVIAAVESAEQAGIPFEGEFRTIFPDGRERWVVARGKTVDEGRGARRMGVVLDITERKQGEESLRESEERFRAMANTAPVMIWMSGADRLCTFFNKGWLDFTGRTMEQELGNGWAEGVHRDDFDHCLRVYVDAFDVRQEFSMEYRLRRNDGEYCWVLDTGVPRFSTDGMFLGYIGSAIDITERKRAEERFRLAVEASPNAIAMVNGQGEIVLINTLTERLFGYSREELIGKSVEILVPERFRAGHPAHRAGFFAAPQSRPMGAGRELFARRKDGTEFPVEIGLNPIETNEGMLVLTAIVDITERKRSESELRRNREELAHLTRITTLGELATSLAHEVNQPLTAILSNAQAAQRFLSKKSSDIEEVREILHDIVQDSNRAGDVIRRMRALVKKEDIEFGSLDLSSTIREILMLVQSDAALRNVRVVLDVSPDLPQVRGDRIQLQQVLLNLLLNAFDAMKDCPGDEREVLLRAEPDGADLVRTSVSDLGPGLTSDKLDRIFQPFFSTKREGLGVGLSISRSIIEAHGGKLWAENNNGRGATFCFTVPIEKRPD
jgi:PAS domain S-box-containing protein